MKLHEVIDTNTTREEKEELNAIDLQLYPLLIKKAHIVETIKKLEKQTPTLLTKYRLNKAKRNYIQTSYKINRLNQQKHKLLNRISTRQKVIPLFRNRKE